MFGQFHGLPVHALAVHAAVVSVPLAALMAVLFVVPRTRQWARWPLLLVSLGAAASVFVAKESGEHLREVLGLFGNSNPAARLIARHEKAANVLFIMILVFAVLAIVAFVLSRNPTAFEGPIAIGVCVVLLVGAGAVAYQTYKTGELGAKAVWNPTGKANFN